MHSCHVHLNNYFSEIINGICGALCPIYQTEFIEFDLIPDTFIHLF